MGLGKGSGTKIVKDFGDSTSIHGFVYMINSQKIFDR